MRQARQLIFFLIAIFFSICAFAQKDTVYLYKLPQGEKNDTLFVYGNSRLSINDSLVKRVFSSEHTKDSIYMLSGTGNFSNQKIYVIHNGDSFPKQYRLYEKQQLAYLKSDSMYKRAKMPYRSMDSLKRLQSNLYKEQQVFYKKNFKADSLNRLNWKTDSIRIKMELKRLKSDLQRIKLDSTRRGRGMEKRSVSFEVNCKPDGKVVIKNLSQKVIVRTFNENKVKIVTTVNVENGTDTDDVDWTKALNLEIESNKEGVTISKQVRTVSLTATGSGNMTLAYSNNKSVQGGEVVESKIYNTSSRTPLEIFIPVNAKVTIDSKYNDIIILNDLSSIEATLTNANIKMEAAQKAIINSRYGNVNAGAIGEANVVLLNCRFTSGDIDTFKINSRYSTVTFDNSRVIDITSISDQYQMNRVGSMTVNKAFGKLSLAYLSNSIVFTGSSSDLNIGAINSSASTVKIDNKYADMKLPLTSLENYSLNFDGKYSSVFTPFEKVRINAADSMHRASANFTRTAGSLNKNYTAFNVSCVSCSVDFR